MYLNVHCSFAKTCHGLGQNLLKNSVLHLAKGQHEFQPPPLVAHSRERESERLEEAAEIHTS